jgi:hypothetical protein
MSGSYGLQLLDESFELTYKDEAAKSSHTPMPDIRRRPNPNDEAANQGRPTCRLLFSIAVAASAEAAGQNLDAV